MIDTIFGISSRPFRRASEPSADSRRPGLVVVCPACSTRFLVDDAALGGAVGRRLRCASCGNLWHYSPTEAAIQAAAPDTGFAAKRPEPSLSLPDEPARLELPADSFADSPAAAPRPSAAVELPAAVRVRRTRLAGIGLISLAAVVVLVAFFAHDTIVALFPSARPVYQTLGLVAPPGAGLNVTVTPTRTPDALIISGSIVNHASVSQSIPALRVTLRDGNKAVLASKVIDPPVAQLSPGETTHFDTTFDHPSITATGVEVTFATD